MLFYFRAILYKQKRFMATQNSSVAYESKAKCTRKETQKKIDRPVCNLPIRIVGWSFSFQLIVFVSNFNCQW